MVPLAFGSQTGGSTILPAAYCGVVGYKASLTGLDRGNIRHLRPTLDTIGLFARSVADIAALRGVLVGTEEAPPAVNVRVLRIGVCRSPYWNEAQPEAVAALENAAATLGRAGGTVRDADLPAVFDGIAETFGVISSVEAARALVMEARDHRAKLNSWIKDSLAAAERHGAQRYDEAQGHAVACQRALGALFDQHDILITPSTTGEAPADLVGISTSVFNRTWTLMHVPCVHLPTSKGPNGMPVGFQVIGPVGGDVRTLAVAEAIASALG
jgi:Asp-tRNA(Asn)/Glu-tRNA(Gln) amidotransferase A subunit family amidase